MVGDGVSDLETKPDEVDLFVGFGRYTPRAKVKAGAHAFVHSLAEMPDPAANEPPTRCSCLPAAGRNRRPVRPSTVATESISAGTCRPTVMTSVGDRREGR